MRIFPMKVKSISIHGFTTGLWMWTCREEGRTAVWAKHFHCYQGCHKHDRTGLYSECHVRMNTYLWHKHILHKYWRSKSSPGLNACIDERNPCWLFVPILNSACVLLLPEVFWPFLQVNRSTMWCQCDRKYLLSWCFFCVWRLCS